MLNAAFLGKLSGEDQRILGFGNKTNFQPCFERQTRIPFAHKAFGAAFSAQLRARELRQRMGAKLRRALKS
jgi:hypothetical protein